MQREQHQFDPVLGIQLSLDAQLYRSSSQGPASDEEILSPELSEIDSVIDRATRTHGWPPIIPQFSGNRTWAWSQWTGTILEQVWPAATRSMIIPALIILGVRTIDPSVSWLLCPEEKHTLIAPLIALGTGWNYILTLATFVTTFFVGHSHTFWRKSYHLSRLVQGRINDLSLLCATHTKRTANGDLTAEGAQLLNSVGRELRLMHLLFYADVVYRRTTGTASFRVLLSADGLMRMRARGLLTEMEYFTLRDSGAPPSRWYLVVLEWIITRIVQANRAGALVGGAGFEQVTLEKGLELRGACMSIPDECAARMPLAYVHLTQVLVDSLLLIAPFALYPRLGIFSVPLTGIMTLFYRGLLELSKSFLDPFGNRRVALTPLSCELGIAVLLGESNAGSLLWPMGARRMPFDTHDMT